MCIVGIGAYGYYSIENWPLLDSLYMAIITLTTTGYGEVHRLSDEGRWFTMIYLVVGLATYALIIGMIVKEIVEIEFNQFFRRSRMNREIEKITDHVIVCGFGKMGKSICQQLSAEKKKFVVIEQDKSKESELKESGYLYLISDATYDDVLEKAQIKKAKHLITAVSSDSENVFITLSARFLNKDVFIISRAYNDSSIEKLNKAGTNKVISPYSLMSTKVTQTIINPAVNDFLEIISEDRTIDFQLAEINVNEKSKCINKSLAETDFKDNGIMIVGVKKQSGETIFVPKSDLNIENGDRLIALGNAKDFTNFLNTEI